MRRTARDWAVVAGLIFLAMLAWGCVSYPEWGHGSPGPPEPPPVETQTPAPGCQSYVDCPEHEICAYNQGGTTGECLKAPVCGQGSAVGKQWGCWDQRSDESEPVWIPDKPDDRPICDGAISVDCWELKDRAWIEHPPVVEQPPVTSPPATQPPQPPAPPQNNCGMALPDYAVKVTEPQKILGPKQQLAPGVWVAVSSCPKDHCTAAELDILAPGVNPKYVEDLRTAFCAGGPCFCYGLGSHVGVSTYKGMLSDGDLENLAERGAVDAYGRRVMLRGNGWVLVANTGPNNVLLWPGPYSYPYWGMCPNKIEEPCPEPTPTPTATPAPPQPPVEGMGITIAVSCGGQSPNCDPHELTTTTDPWRTYRVKIVGGKGTDVLLDASYYINQRGNKVHDYDPRYPGPLVSWEQLTGEHVDCTDIDAINPNGMVLRCGKIDEAGYGQGDDFTWRACNAAGLCGEVTVEARR